MWNNPLHRPTTGSIMEGRLVLHGVLDLSTMYRYVCILHTSIVPRTVLFDVGVLHSYPRTAD